MSELTITSEVRAVAEGLRRQQVIDVVRAGTFMGALLLAWISLHPFTDLSEMELGDTSTGNEAMTYLIFAGLAVLTVGLAMRDNWVALKTLLSRPMLLFGGWVMFTVVLSLDPGTSLRRLALTVCVMAVTASMMLLPKTQHELMRWLSISALIVLVLSYLGIIFVPHLAIHLASDPQEPGLAGNWRGLFGHKNLAAGVTVMLLFIGIYAMRCRAFISGGSIVFLSLLFLIFSAGKSSLTLCFAVLLLTSSTYVIRSLWARALVLMTPLLLLNLLSVGTVIFTGLADIAKLLPLDATFTGRTDIWGFAVQSLQSRLATGYGFSAFWGSSAIQGLPEGKEWAAFASHSHNGYLDTALGMGLPGLALLLVLLVVEPLRNFQRAEMGGNSGPLAMLLFQIWLFGLYLSSMESFFLDRADPLWFTFLLAIFGLHYLGRFRTRA